MDKIQSAIKKARVARDQLGPQEKAAPRVPKGPGRPTGQTSVAQNWSALEDYHFEPAVIARNRLVSFGGGGPAVSFDVMRTKILQQMRANKWRRLAITSPGSGCGKTTTCLNLAFSLGRQKDLRTMIIEADLRRPSMAQALGLTRQHSFASVLQGTSPAAENLVRHWANLAFGTNNEAARNPAELLHSAKVRDVLAQIDHDYAPDIMVFDMPPMQGSDDTIGFMSQVDCVLLIAAAGSTTVREVDLAEQELASQTNVLGVVLNKCRYLEKSRGYDDYSYYA
jgi:protein-tyrosine kinase